MSAAADKPIKCVPAIVSGLLPNALMSLKRNYGSGTNWGGVIFSNQGSCWPCRRPVSVMSSALKRRPEPVRPRNWFTRFFQVTLYGASVDSLMLQPTKSGVGMLFRVSIYSVLVRNLPCSLPATEVEEQFLSISLLSRFDYFDFFGADC